MGVFILAFTPFPLSLLDFAVPDLGAWLGISDSAHSHTLLLVIITCMMNRQRIYCAVHSERGLGCALIKSTLGSGNPGRVGNLEGERTREQGGTKGISSRATWD